jgi:hypothetical protein
MANTLQSAILVAKTLMDYNFNLIIQLQHVTPPYNMLLPLITTCYSAFFIFRDSEHAHYPVSHGENS